jgi:hypothetical protein
MAVYVMLDRVLALPLGHSMVKPCRALDHLAQHDAGHDLDFIVADGCQSFVLPESDAAIVATRTRLCR